MIWSPLAALCDTKISGEGMLLKVTLTPPSDVESGTLLAEAVVVLRFVPKMETREPAATAWPLVKLAPFNTPPFAIAGCAHAAAPSDKIAAMKITGLKVLSLLHIKGAGRFRQ